jgi:hypothetical protein
MARAQAGPDAACVVELPIRKRTRPASVSAGRCYSNELAESSASQHRPATPPLAPPLAPRRSRARGSASGGQSIWGQGSVQ